MVDRFGRTIDSIRISVTPLCNLRCVYCYPESDCSFNSNIISSKLIIELARKSVDLGINRIKFTGGEPLLRSDICEIIHEVSLIEGILDLSLTTNGVFLAEKSDLLAKSGLNRINISLDTLDRNIFQQITGKDHLLDVLNGIQVAKKSGFSKIKLNTVLIKDINEHEISEIKQFAIDNGLEHQLINMMLLTEDKVLFENFSVAERPPPCGLCSRIRFSSDGKLLPCLFSDIQISLEDFSSMDNALEECVKQKPESGTKAFSRSMYEIGG